MYIQKQYIRTSTSDTYILIAVVRNKTDAQAIDTILYPTFTDEFPWDKFNCPAHAV